MDNKAQFEKGVFELNYKGLRWSAISLNQNEGLAYRLLQFVLWIVAVSSALSGLVELFQNLDDPIVTIENLAIAGALFLGAYYQNRTIHINRHFVAIIKLFSICYIRNDVAKYLILLNSGVFVEILMTDNKEKKQIIKSTIWILKFYYYFYQMYPIAYIVFGNTPVFQARFLSYENTSNWILPFGGFSAFDIQKNPNYTIAWIYQNISNFLLYIMYANFSCLFIAILVYLNLQCKLLQHYIRTDLIPNEMTDKILYWDQLKKNLKFIIIYHNSIIDVSKKCSEAFAFTNLVDFVGIAVITANSICYGLLINTFNFRLVQMLTLGSSAIITEFFVSYWSNEFTFNYNRIGDACYDINFLNTDAQVQNALRFIIQRSQKSVEFTVGKLRPLNMQTFVTVVKSAYSVYMIVRRSS